MKFLQEITNCPEEDKQTNFFKDHKGWILISQFEKKKSEKTGGAKTFSYFKSVIVSCFNILPSIPASLKTFS